MSTCLLMHLCQFGGAASGKNVCIPKSGPCDVRQLLSTLVHSTNTTPNCFAVLQQHVPATSSDTQQAVYTFYSLESANSGLARVSVSSQTFPVLHWTTPTQTMPLATCSCVACQAKNGAHYPNVGHLNSRCVTGLRSAMYRHL